jgi:DNA-binding transcriptional ArsR family regulator
LLFCFASTDKFCRQFSIHGNAVTARILTSAASDQRLPVAISFFAVFLAVFFFSKFSEGNHCCSATRRADTTAATEAAIRPIGYTDILSPRHSVTQDHTMATNAKFAEVAALVGDPARACMLQAMMDGRALTATELARAAGVAPQTASGHLARLTAGGLVNVVPQGRHRYHCIASPTVAQMLESIMLVAAGGVPSHKPVATGPRDLGLRRARLCYDHMAGRLGVALADALVANGYVELTGDAGSLTPSGCTFLSDLGLDIEGLHVLQGKRAARVLCRPCIDWSERRPHLAGILGAALCTHSLKSNWIRRIVGGRALDITPKGTCAFRVSFGVRMEGATANNAIAPPHP